MPTIIIDEKQYEVKDGQNLLAAALSVGLDLPYFCWHPALGSIGACRQCAVQHFKDENDTQGRMIMACMTPPTEGMRVSVKHPNCASFRKNVIEWMMQNHPHDCPVCDEGGECHLQDMTVMTGHNYRRYRFKKRTFVNQNLGPLIHHEMNRCITCYRCVRYYQGVAGGRDLAAFSLSNKVYFGREQDGVLESEFSGNLVEVCPTGVFTDKPFRRTYTRKWDLQTAPSVCQLCSLGCNILPGERYDTIRRVQNRFNPDINGYFLCDRGRFGHSFVNSTRRLAPSNTPIVAFERGQKVMGIGSPRASLETNFALRDAVGEENFYLGLPRNQAELTHKIVEIIKSGSLKSASLAAVSDADAVLILGEDLTNTAPMLAMAIRQGVLKRDEDKAALIGIPTWHDQAVRCSSQLSKSTILSATVIPTKLDDIALKLFHAAPISLANLGFAIAHEIAADAKKPDDLSSDEQAMAQQMAAVLLQAKNPVIISGPSLGSAQIIESAANIALALNKKNINAEICYIQEEANSLGLALLGTKNLDDALDDLKSKKYSACVVVELDLARRLAPHRFNEFLAQVPELVAMDYFEHMTTQQAHRTLSSPAFSETTGTLVNNEGRAQRFYKVFHPKKSIPDAWRTIGQLFNRNFTSLDELTQTMWQTIKELKPWATHEFHANFRLLHQKIPRETPEYSGRTVMNTHISMHEQAPPKDPDTPLAHSMEGFTGQPPSELTPFFWAPGWNSVSALNKYQKPVGVDYSHGHLGIRLFEPIQHAMLKFFEPNNTRHKKTPGVFEVIPHHQIFGSEERASLSPALEARQGQSFVGMSESDAQNYKISPQKNIILNFGEEEYIFQVKIFNSLMPGTILVPLGMKACPLLALPTTCTLKTSEAAL